MTTSFDDVPGVGRPAREALARAGYEDLESLDAAAWGEVLALHGVGRRGLERLQEALRERGLSMAGAPEPQDRSATFTARHTGANTGEMAGARTGKSAQEYVDNLETPRRVRHGRRLLEIFGRVTGAPPVMWGESMIGYGELHYQYATGREGDTFRVGFSPRKAKISLYGLPHDERFLGPLGKHTLGASCIYINKPEDIDLAVLEEMIAHGWSQLPDAR